MGASTSKSKSKRASKTTTAAASAATTQQQQRTPTAMSSSAHSMEADPDMMAENQTLANLDGLTFNVSKHVAQHTEQGSGGGGVCPFGHTASTTTTPEPFRFIPLQMSGGSFQGDAQTAALLQEIGGVAALKSAMDRFYAKMFADPHLDQFVHTQTDPHAQRLGNWIAEKMDSSQPVWSHERRERSRCPVSRTLPHVGKHHVHDRSSAHFAAWNSPKRAPDVAGNHFQLHDARNWMRVNFWAVREAGLFDKSPTFESWYIRFLAHFVRVYERAAPAFAKDSFRWSADEGNLAAYAAAGNRMPASVMGATSNGVPTQAALATLPEQERNAPYWPYGDDDTH